MHFRFSSLRLLVIAISLISSSISCSRKSEQATLSLDFSSENSALSVGKTIEYVFIKFDNEPTIEVACRTPNSSGQDVSNGKCNSLSYELNPGPHKIQIFVAVEEFNTTTQKESLGFYYNGQTVDLKRGNHPHNPLLTRVEGSENEAMVSGRYIPTSTVYPGVGGKYLTGDIAFFVKPSSTLPRMKLLDFEIFGGYTNFSVFQNVPGVYIFNGFDQNGTAYSNIELFKDLYSTGGAGLKANSSGLAFNNNQRVHYDLNGGLYWDQRDNHWTQRDFIKKVVGFFGQNSDNRYLCTNDDPTGSTFGGSENSRLCSSANCTNNFSWSDISVGGTMDGVGDTCSSAAGLSVDLMDLGDDDDFINFAGPFLGAEFPTEYDAIDYDEDTYTYSWNFNPNVYLPGGVEFWVLANGNGFDEDSVRAPKSEGLLCDKLPPAGFSLQGTFTPTSHPSGSFTIPAAMQTANTKVAVCLKRPNGGYYLTGNVDDGEDNGGGSVPTQIAFRKVPRIDGGTGVMFSNTCYPMEVVLMDSGMNPAHSSSPVQVNLSTTGTGSFHSSAEDCFSVSDPIGNIHTQSRDIVFYNNPDTTSSYSLDAVDDVATLSPGSFAYTAMAPVSPEELRIIPDFYRSNDFAFAHTEKCVSFYIAAFGDTGGGNYELVQGTAVTYNIGATGTLTTSAGITSALVNTDCDGSSTSAGGLSGRTLKRLNLEVDTNLAAETISNILSGATGVTTSYDETFTSVAPGSFHHFHAESSHQMGAEAGDCVKIKVVAFDNHKPNSYPTNFPDSMNIDFTDNSSDGGLLINDSMTPAGAPFECDGAVDTDILNYASTGTLGPAPAGPFRQLFYKANMSASSVDIDFTYHGQTSNVNLVTTTSSFAYLSTSLAFYDFSSIADTSLPVTGSTIGLTNESATAIASAGAGSQNSDFNISSESCSPGVTASGSCTLDPEFANGGSGLGMKTGLLYIDYDNGNATTRRTQLIMKGDRQ